MLQFSATPARLPPDADLPLPVTALPAPGGQPGATGAAHRLPGRLPPRQGAVGGGGGGALAAHEGRLRAAGAVHEGS